MMNNENSLAQKCKILEIMNIYLTNLLLHREEKTHGLQEGHHEESQKVASKDGNTLWNWKWNTFFGKFVEILQLLIRNPED